MASDDRIIRIEHLPDDFLEEARQGLAATVASRTAASPSPLGSGAAPFPGALMPPAPSTSGLTDRPGSEPSAATSLEEMELRAMRRVLDETGGNISEAAKRLGISRNTIYRKLRWSQRDST